MQGERCGKLHTAGRAFTHRAEATCLPDESLLPFPNCRLAITFSAQLGKGDRQVIDLFRINEALPAELLYGLLRMTIGTLEL